MGSPAAHTFQTLSRPPQTILDQVVTNWQKDLATSRKAQAYLKGRGLWHPDLLRALRVGYSSGRLPQVTPAQGKLKRQLEEMGLLNERGNESFFNRVVIPFFDEAGVLVGIYGRAVGDSKLAHLYMKGPHRGVFNRIGIQDASAVILTEAPLDALSLLILGFPHTTASFGANGFTADLRAALVKAKTTRVYCVYDADPAGDMAADQLAHDLAGHGIEVLRVGLACKDPNDFLKAGGTPADFQKLLDQASVIPVSAQTTAVVAVGPSTAASEPANLSAVTKASGAESPVVVTTPAAPPSSVLTVTLGDRIYQLDGPPVATAGHLQVVLRVTRQTRTFVDSLNLLADRARAAFVSRAFTAFRGQVLKKTLEDDFFVLLDEVETFARQNATAPTSPVGAMTTAEREAALTFLKRPDLISLLLVHITQLGVVGEDDNKLLVYLVATSCQLDHPLSLSVISQSSAGKSWILNRTLDLFPPERVMRLTRMSPRALFYEEVGKFRHKVLFVEEAIGAKDADLGVRSMQSEKRLANLATMTDPKTGKLTTQETVVEGPLTYMTSSVESLDYETSTRSFEITIDESPAQTARIVERLRHGRTLAGLRERMAVEAVIQLHRNAQRLLEKVKVVNEYADQLTFPNETLRLRREADKYFSLIETVAFLDQYQRPRASFIEGGQTVEYIEVVPSDVDIANRLIVSCLVRALSDLTGTAQDLLFKIRDHVTRESTTRRCDVLCVPFSRKDLREVTKWSNSQLNQSLEDLVNLEYLEVTSGSFGKRYVYTLGPDHRLVVQSGLTEPEKIIALGLTPADRLIDPAEFCSQKDLSRK